MWVTDSPRVRRSFAVAWVVFASTNALLMYLLPGEETIPYHLIWASFAFLYGLSPWRPALTWSVFSAITIVTGIAMIRHASMQIIGWEECSEIVLMGVIAGLLIWHVNRHWDERRQIAELREAERVRAANRELATRFGSHELRTRLTIARGLTDLIRATTDDQSISNDAALAVSELDKATTLASSLMTLFRVDGSQELDELDLDELLDSLVRRWTARADRDWVATPAVGTVLGHAERLEAAVDCLVENAVKFTQDGDRITIDAWVDGRDAVVAVSDTGAGIPPEDLDRVTELFHTSSNAGERAGHGLGLAIVRAAVDARGGTLSIASSLGVGTRITIRFPHGQPAGPVDTLFRTPVVPPPAREPELDAASS
jgi:signal transduction histidine kinase